MEKLDFVEGQAWRNAAYSLESMELMSKRAHALVTLLLDTAYIATACTPLAAALGVGLSAWLR